MHNLPWSRDLSKLKLSSELRTKLELSPDLKQPGQKITKNKEYCYMMTT